MEDQHLLEDIFQRYLKNECTQFEVKLLLEHFQAGANEDCLRDLIAKRLSEYPAELSPGTEEALDATFNNILSRIAREEMIEEQDTVFKKSTGPVVMKLIAGITLIVFVFGSIYSYRVISGSKTLAIAKRQSHLKISPGRNKATLTLQDGSTIVLDDVKNGKVAQQGNAMVVKMANGQVVYKGTNGDINKVVFNTMSTPRGGQYQLTLPDGTEVWLNSASSITYPTAFVGSERRVTVTGEAYFEVAHDSAKPFHVKAGEQNIEVLGTQFNVMAYADEDAIKTTLVVGSVKVSQNAESGILKPGQQSVNRNGAFKIGSAAIDEALAWKNGYFKFNRVGIKPIMRQLARWYNVQVVYEGHVKDDEFVGTIGRGESIEQALHLLELTNMHFKVKDKTIIVLPY